MDNDETLIPTTKLRFVKLDNRFLLQQGFEPVTGGTTVWKPVPFIDLEEAKDVS